MAGQTPSFGLNFFGGDTPGDLDDDAGKFTGDDRLTIDRLFSTVRGHNHHLASALTPPDITPLVALADSSVEGTLEGGTTYYYVVSFVNGDGLETVTGPEGSVTTPELLEIPDAPAGETSAVPGNILLPGLYFYALTALRGEEESAQGEPDAITVLNTDNTVTLTLPDLGDADEYQIWRMGDDDPGWTRIGTSSTGTFIDDGSVEAAEAGDPDNTPPNITTGAGTYAITITLDGDDATQVQDATAWRIYRSEVSGVYTAASLVHEVVEHESDTDATTPLRITWIDDGDALLTGSPKLFSTEMVISPYTVDAVIGAGPLPDATPYPDNYPITDAAGVLYLARSGAWVAVSGASRGVALYTGTGNPTGVEPAGAVNGDVFIDTATGDIYVIDGL